MRYSEDHKAKTHQRIIEEAARLFRQDGVGATGLQPLMKTLGLTHGGFYAHFKSKDELVEKALGHAVERLNTSLAIQSQSLPAFIKYYLSSAHRADPGTGCPLTTLCAELGQRGQPSEITDSMVNNRLAMIEAALPEDEHADEQAVLMFSAMVGALLLSRSVSDPALSDRLLKTTRKLLIEQAEASAEA
ncbi:TetR/AcrR family transcriptional regulator [Pseudomonas sp. Marseille-Q8238]